MNRRTKPRYTYLIGPNPEHLGGGWELRLLTDGKHVGGGLFKVPPADPALAAQWWNRLCHADRTYWLDLHPSGNKLNAYQSCQLSNAYTDAEDTAHDWLGSYEAM